MYDLTQITFPSEEISNNYKDFLHNLTYLPFSISKETKLVESSPLYPSYDYDCCIGKKKPRLFSI